MASFAAEIDGQKRQNITCILLLNGAKIISAIGKSTIDGYLVIDESVFFDTYFKWNIIRKYIPHFIKRRISKWEQNLQTVLLNVR